MTRLTWLIPILLVSCSTMNVHFDRDPSVDFSALKTYEWVSPGKDSLLEGRVQKAVNVALKAKGYQSAASGSADFRITYDASKATRMEIQSYGASYGDPHSPSSPVETYYYEVGTLILDITNPTTSKVMWRGWAEAEIPNKISPEEREKRIQEAVNKILANFPSRT